jgi:uncharacterized membrane-anchored protein YitT (DUF2179 family)
MSETASEGPSYSGAVTAFPYAFRISDSRAFKLYAVVGGFIALFGTVFFMLAIVSLLGRISGTPAGILTFQPALYLIVWLFTIAPIAAPVLLVARQYRLGRGNSSYDKWIAVAGFAFIVSIYLAAIITTPVNRQSSVGPIVRSLYELPPITGVIPPLLAAAGMAIVHRMRG